MIPSVPLKVDIDPEDSTTTSVSASWPYPGDIVEYFLIECSNGTPSNSAIMPGLWNEDDNVRYTVSCLNVTVPGNNYTMTVTSFSNDQLNSAEIVLTACKQYFLLMLLKNYTPFFFCKIYIVA